MGEGEGRERDWVSSDVPREERRARCHHLLPTCTPHSSHINLSRAQQCKAAFRQAKRALASYLNRNVQLMRHTDPSHTFAAARGVKIKRDGRTGTPEWSGRSVGKCAFQTISARGNCDIVALLKSSIIDPANGNRVRPSEATFFSKRATVAADPWIMACKMLVWRPAGKILQMGNGWFKSCL